MQVGRRQPRRVITWDESDVHTPWRHLLIWSRGSKRQIKRRTRRRERREGKADIAEDRGQG